MKYNNILAPIIKVNSLNKDIYEFWIQCDVGDVRPGQFVNIKIDGFTLRRPISVCDIDKEKSLLRIVFEIRGEGTKQLSQYNVANYIEIMFPLGNGFTILPSYKNAVFVGGGIGVPPLLYLSKAFKGNSYTVLGFRSFNKVILEEDFKKSCKYVYLTTDDGSYGEKGTVIKPLEKILESDNIDIVYTCGPLSMMRAVFDCCKKYDIDCQVSMEERMGCAIGACLVCACDIKCGKEIKKLHVCKDGPVFKASEVFFCD